MADKVRRTTLPEAAAEGAGNFGAEPDLDLTGGPQPANIAERQEMGLPATESPDTAAGDEGNVRGGEPVEAAMERRASSGAQLEAAHQSVDENTHGGDVGPLTRERMEREADSRVQGHEDSIQGRNSVPEPDPGA